jgi:hypothetical protein
MLNGIKTIVLQETPTANGILIELNILILT